MVETDKRIFSVKREDLPYNFSGEFEDVFCFSVFKTDEATPITGIRFKESSGFDFKQECTPKIELRPIEPASFREVLKEDVSNYCVRIFIIDIGLKIRKELVTLDCSDLTAAKLYQIDLISQSDLSFSQGFEVQCFISRKETLNLDVRPSVWHKSQHIHFSSFVAKTSTENTLFDISWVIFEEPDKRDTVLYIDWKSQNVSSDIAIDCFEVKANEDLREQFRRLENNKQFGQFSVRIFGSKILYELITQCLELADLDQEPSEDSLHGKLVELFRKHGLDFNELAKRIQNRDTESSEKLYIDMDMYKFAQKVFSLGTELRSLKFGGFR